MYSRNKIFALHFSKFSLYRSKKVAWSGLEWPGVAWSGLEWPGAALSGLEWPGAAWSGLELPCFA